MDFRDYLQEKKIPTVGMIKKLLKSLDFQNINPEFFDVEKKNSDAGMGGYDYLQINFDKKDALSPKRASDVKLALMSLSTKYGADTSKAKDGYLIIEDTITNFDVTNEAIKTHPDLKEMLKLLKAAGLKAKVQYGTLNVPFEKGVSEEEAIKKFMNITKSWTWKERTDRAGIYTSGDLSFSGDVFSGKYFIGVNS